MAKVKFKVGDKVICTETNAFFKKGQIYTVHFHDKDGTVGSRDANNPGGYLGMAWILEENLQLVKENQTQNLNTTIMTLSAQQRKDLVLQVAQDLCKPNNSITTLEIKMELRKRYPDFLWNKYYVGSIPGVSDLFHELVREGKFRSIADNGIFQTYADVNWLSQAPVRLFTKRKKVSAPKKATFGGGTPQKGQSVNKTTGQPVSHTDTATGKTLAIPKGSKSISAKKAKEMMTNNKGQFFTAVFTKQDGTTRILNGQYLKDQQDGTNNVKVREAGKAKATPQDSIRNVPLDRLHALRIAGNVYRVK